MPVVHGHPPSSLAGGGGPLSVGARITSGATWGEGFEGQINQVALYNAALDGRKVSLVLHQMATRAGIMLGSPVPSALQDQPWTDPEEAHRRLDRRPIALITLQNSDFVDNYVFGQSPKWRPDPMNQGEVEDWLKERIQEILTAGDDYEIMFNRPGGKYEEDIVPSYVFGWSPATLPGGAEKMILDEQWAAMRNTWTAFNLTHFNDLPTVNSGDLRARRAWFYTGGGMPLNEDGSLNTHGYMFNRSVGPSTPEILKFAILDAWLEQDPNEDPDLQRFRCLFLDATSLYYGLHVQTVHSTSINENFTLVGEAIPDDDAARQAAAWFSLVRFPQAPWWNNNKRSDGYNPYWSLDPVTRPVYFGVIDDAYVDLTEIGQFAQAGNPSNLTLGEIYLWILKGGTPVAWNGQYRTIAVAWDFAMKRIPVSRVCDSPRTMRIARV